MREKSAAGQRTGCDQSGCGLAAILVLEGWRQRIPIPALADAIGEDFADSHGRSFNLLVGWHHFSAASIIACQMLVACGRSVVRLDDTA